MLDENVIEESGKFHVLDKKLDYHRDQGNRVLLFSQFTTVLDIMEIFLKRKKIKFIRLDGSTPVPERLVFYMS
jgi:SWI/SNF-related matrix-associated actin-dependent regulator 1 of chromatin subfamily A